ncbi:MAG: CoA transferase [Dehalococcoidia bacterium]|nr:CoA transferase [Dehalococcoidia bacterium]
MASGPLAGVKVLEFSQIIAGPFGGMLLADMGAEVTKFEPLEGEPWRTFVELVPKESRTYASLNRGKRGVAIDMAHPSAREVIARLARDADVVMINYRPGVAEKLGIDYETLRAVNPKLIYCENTAFGKRGPLAERGGYDLIVQALSGLMAGEAKMNGDVPTYVYPAVADYATGILISGAISAALYAREKTGEGQRIDCTLLATAIAMQTSQFTWIEAFDDATFPPMIEAIRQARLDLKSFEEQVEIHNTFRPVGAGNVYYRVYQTADGFLAVGALSRPLWAKVRAATGLIDPRAKPDGTFDQAPEGWETEGPKLVAEAEALFRTKSTAEWGSLLQQHGVPSGPVHFIEELFEHPQAVENGLVTEMDHPLLGHMKMVGPAFQMSGTPLAPQGPSPVLGADTAQVLREAGYTEEEIAGMAAAGFIGIA